MSLSSLVDKPLMQNPLAGGGAPQIIDPSVITPRGGAPETDDPILQGFYNSEFYKPNAPTTMDVVNYTYQGNPMTGSSSNISQFQQYLDSIGKGNLIQRNDQIFSQETGPLATMEGQTPPGFGPQVIDQKLIDQTEFNQFPGNPNRKPADPANLGSAKVGIFPFPGMDSTETATATVPNPMQTGDQGLMDRLTSLEQGIGSLQNQIANLFQMGQASDPFGLSGFINTRRY